MIDTHCHLTFKELHEAASQVIDRAAAAGVDRMISVGTSPDDARNVVALAERFGNVYATVGVHPHYVDRWDNRDEIAEAISVLAGHPKVVALGECGLDRHYPDPPMDLQRKVFQWQLEIAQEHSALPIVIHNREATDDTLAMLRDSGIPGKRFQFHCFTGKRDELEKILAFDAMVSFTGIVTFKSAKDLADCSDIVPDDRLMIETDSPYLTPEPNRKVRPNEPCYVADVARFLAARRGKTLEEFVGIVDGNADRFFDLNPA